MVAFFFSEMGYIATMVFKNQSTVTAEWYPAHCLPRVFKARSSAHPKSILCRLILHHDNARPHTVARTSEFLQKNDIRILLHPPYFLELAHCETGWTI